MPSRLSTIVFALALAFGSFACSKPKPPKITPRSVAVSAVTPKGVTLSLELDVENPNPFPLIARKVSGTLALDSGTELGSGSAEPNGSIPANGSKLVQSRLDVSFATLGALAPLALSDKPAPYTFRGTATVGGEKLNVDVPFSVHGQFTRAQILQAGMRGLGIGLPTP